MFWALLKAGGALLARVPWQVWVALGIALGVLWYGHSQKREGIAETEAKYAARERDRQAQAAADRAATEKRFRDQENKHAHAMANLDRQFTAEIAASEDRARRDRAAAGRGDIVLRIPGPACDGSAATEAPAPAAAAGKRHGAETVELPRAVTQDLLDLVNDADRVADQLRACQAIVRADREQP